MMNDRQAMNEYMLEEVSGEKAVETLRKLPEPERVKLYYMMLGMQLVEEPENKQAI